VDILIPVEKSVHNKELLDPKFFIISSEPGKGFKAPLPPRHSLVIEKLKFLSGPGDSFCKQMWAYKKSAPFTFHLCLLKNNKRKPTLFL